MELLPEGRYHAVICAHGLGVASTGTAFIWLECEVLRPTQDPPEGMMSLPQVRTVYLYLTPATIQRTQADLRQLGWCGDDPLELDDGQVLVGKECVLTCKHEDYRGQTRERWWLHRSLTRELSDTDREHIRHLWRKADAEDHVPF
jgi:hypothetical protein